MRADGNRKQAQKSMTKPETTEEAATARIECDGLFGIWRVDYGHNSQIVAIPSTTQDIQTALPMIRDALPKPPWESYSGLVFLGTVNIPNVEDSQEDDSNG